MTGKNNKDPNRLPIEPSELVEGSAPTYHHTETIKIDKESGGQESAQPGGDDSGGSSSGSGEKTESDKP